MVMHDEDMSLIHLIRFRTALKEWTRASPLQKADPLDRNQRRRDFLKTRSWGPTDGTCVQRIVKGIIKTVMLTCRKHKLADQNLPARDSARSRNIRRSRKRISAIDKDSNWKDYMEEKNKWSFIMWINASAWSPSSWKLSEQICLKLAETKFMNSLNRNAKISSEYVQISDIKISYGVFG